MNSQPDLQSELRKNYLLVNKKVIIAYASFDKKRSALITELDALLLSGKAEIHLTVKMRKRITRLSKAMDIAGQKLAPFLNPHRKT